MKNIFIVLLLLISYSVFAQRRVELECLRVGFWNVQNLFDTINDAGVADGQFTPTGQKRWDSVKYSEKVDMLSQVVRRMDMDILGLCEVENRGVVEDLVYRSGIGYGIVHYESCDPRGIDQALLYDASKVSLLSSGLVSTSTDKPKRELLYALFCRGVDTIAFYVVHLPSKLGGEVAKVNRGRIVAQLDSLVNVNPYQVVIMGDMNDDPIEVSGMVNAAKPLHDNGFGSYTYRGNNSMLDQLLYTNGLRFGELLLENNLAKSRYGRDKRASDHRAIKIYLLL